MKNILYLHGYVKLYGAERALVRLIKGLDREAFCPFVILPMHGQLSEELKKYGVHCYKFPMSVINRYGNLIDIARFFIMIIPSIVFIMVLIKFKKIDIVHTNTSHIFVGAISAKLMGVRNIWHIREITVSPKLITKILSFLIGIFSDRIIAVSKATAKALKLHPFYSQKICIIYDGVDLDVFKPNRKSPDSIYRVGLIGRFTAWKGQLIFVKAASLVLKKYNNVKFYIIGEIDTIRNNTYRSELLRLIGELGMKDCIELFGFCADMPEVYSNLDISVIASISPDPCPNVALESMAMNKIIIASDIGGVPEILTDQCAILVRPRDPQQLADGIISVLQNPNNFKILSQQAGQRAAQYFSSNKNIKDILNIYCELLHLHKYF